MYIGKIDSEERQFVSKTLVEYADKTRKTNKISDDSKVKLISNMLILSDMFESMAEKALTIRYKTDEEDLFKDLFRAITKNHDSVSALFMVSKDLSVEALNKVKHNSVDKSLILISDTLGEGEIEVNIAYMPKIPIYEPSYILEQLF